MPAVAPSNSTLPLKSGTASKVNALPVAEEVNLGILEFSSTLNNPLPVCNSLTLVVSNIVNILVSTDLILFPLISTEPNVFVADTTACIWLEVPNTDKVFPPPIICVVEVSSLIVHPAVDVAILIVSFIASTKLVAEIEADKFALSPKSKEHSSLNSVLNFSSVSVSAINFTAISFYLNPLLNL